MLVTDAVAALVKDPSIAGWLIVFWHVRAEWPERCANFKATNDSLTMRMIFQQPCRFALFDTGAGLTMPMKESEKRVGGAGWLGKFIDDIRKPSVDASRADRRMHDLCDIAALSDPAGTCKWDSAQAPTVKVEFHYNFSKTNSRLLRVIAIDRVASFTQLDQALAPSRQAMTTLTDIPRLMVPGPIRKRVSLMICRKLREKWACSWKPD